MEHDAGCLWWQGRIPMAGRPASSRWCMDTRIVLRRKFESPVSKYQGSLNSDELATERRRRLTWLFMQLVPRLLGIGTPISGCVRHPAPIFSLDARRFRVYRSGISAVGSDPAAPSPDIWIFPFAHTEELQPSGPTRAARIGGCVGFMVR